MPSLKTPARTQRKAKTTVGMVKSQGENLYNSARVLKAYEDGKKAGFELRDEIYLKTFKDNLDNTFEAAERIISLLKEEKIKCDKVLIRPVGIKEFTLFFIVSNKKYCSVEFAKIYSLAADKVKDIESEVFELNFSFLPNSTSLDEEKLKDDNFLMIYNGKKSRARKA